MLCRHFGSTRRVFAATCQGPKGSLQNSATSFGLQVNILKDCEEDANRLTREYWYMCQKEKKLLNLKSLTLQVQCATYKKNLNRKRGSYTLCNFNFCIFPNCFCGYPITGFWNTCFPERLQYLPLFSSWQWYYNLLETLIFCGLIWKWSSYEWTGHVIIFRFKFQLVRAVSMFDNV